MHQHLLDWENRSKTEISPIKSTNESKKLSPPLFSVLSFYRDKSGDVLWSDDVIRKVRCCTYLMCCYFFRFFTCAVCHILIQVGGWSRPLFSSQKECFSERTTRTGTLKNGTSIVYSSSQTEEARSYLELDDHKRIKDKRYKTIIQQIK